MSRNDALDFAQRLYARLPSNYRVYDAEQGQPLFALLRVVGEQAANLRQDLDALWDNFFIETCDDWVVPYIGALAGTNLLQQPVGQSNRLDVWNTVMWRRSKGTPQMLEALAQSISGWPSDLAEFFQTLGWSQNMNHVRLDRPLTPPLRSPYPLGLLGRANDPNAHAADFHPSSRLAEPQGSFGSQGRYQIQNVGFFVRRLQTFPVRGVTPAAAPPGVAPAAGNSCFTFNPLFRDAPLFASADGSPLSRSAFSKHPWDSFGNQGDIAVRQFGVLLAADAAPKPVPVSGSLNPFTFAAAGAGLTLDPAAGMRLMEADRFQLGAISFTISAQWKSSATVSTLGSLNTRNAAAGKPAFTAGSPAPGTGQLVLQVAAGSGSPRARFPGAVVAIRAKSNGPVRSTDGLYAYLPPSFVDARSGPQVFFIADDGSAYSSAVPASATLARAAEGQAYPPRLLNPSARAVEGFVALNRKGNGLMLLDPSRFGGAGVLVEASLNTGPGAFQPLGGVATVAEPAAGFTELQTPDPWPAFTYAPSKVALSGQVPSTGLLSVLVKPLSGNVIPAAELIVQNRAGQSLLVYLPQVLNATAAGVRLLVADDGSTYFAPADPAQQTAVLRQGSLSGLVLARAAEGQALPLPGVWPLQQRRPVSINLCSSLRSSLLAPDELGIDPELGRFALHPGDPALAGGGLSVDFVEAFNGEVGAFNFDRQLDAGSLATRLVSHSGDADSPLTAVLTGAPVHATLAEAIAAAKDGDVIEIVDSASYSSPPVTLSNAAVKTLTIRAAADQRPCLLFYQAGGAPAASALTVNVPMTALSLNGLLLSGGPIVIQTPVLALNLKACTIDPEAGLAASLVSNDANLNSGAAYVLTGCITGGLRSAAGVTHLTIADSIIDSKTGNAISGVALPASPPVLNASARTVQLERVTVFGSIFCNVFNASECLLNDRATVQDQQSGCVRFTRFEAGSILPRRYLCIPNDEQLQACSTQARCIAPVYHSRRFGRPGYAQLASACSREILSASESGAEVGAFAAGQNTIRLANLRAKLQEFMPVGLSAVVIAET